MELYKRLKRYSSLLISKKTVIFIINSEKQIFTEFNENTNILSLKKYVAQHLNNKYIDLLYNGQIVNNKLNLNDLCRDNEKIKRLFFQVISKKDVKRIKDEEKKIKNYKKEINKIKNNNLNLNNELLKLKKENSEKKIENQNNAEKFKNINEIYEKQEKEINELKNELIKIKDNINEINNININKNKYLIENNEFEIISNKKIKKSNSIVFLASTYTINGNGKNINSKSLINKQLSANILKKPKSIINDYSTINTNNLDSNNSEIRMDSNPNLLYSTTSTKREMNKNLDNIDKDKEIIKKGYNPKYIEINLKFIDKDLSLEHPDIINNIKKWFIIFQFLDINEQLLFSVIDKKNGICILYYWINYLNNKIKSIEKRNDNISNEYSSINEANTFVLTHFAKAAFKMLNNSIYSKTFEKPIDYFKDENNYIIALYKILFQLTNIIENEDIINMDNDIFLTKMIDNMKTKNGEGGSLGNYIQKLILNKIDFSFINLVKIIEIMQKYNIDKFNTSEISKKDKTSGVISVIIRDILIFMGLILDEKNKDDKNIPKYNIVGEYKNNLCLKESYLNTIGKIKSIILNRFNIS